MPQAHGSFEVTLTPQVADGHADEMVVARMTLAKVFQGDLVGTGRGQMLAMHTEVEGSAAYVAIERVEGSLHDRRGSFALQHYGVRTRGRDAQLTIAIVPDSGTEQLRGIEGQLAIDIVEDQHHYHLTYSLPDSP
ncbi:MAG: DUF3224 domain-containing protein [Gammaproteobacteria bacterium]|nr:DUF3224 domain-containing protein [Gammaproteobacteria bacterium]